MSCQDCPIAKSKLPSGAWAILNGKGSYPGFVKIVRAVLCPRMKTLELEHRCTETMLYAAGQTQHYAPRSWPPYFRTVLIMAAAAEADKAQERRVTTTRVTDGVQSLAEIFG